MLRNVGTHVKQFSDGTMQKMFKFAKIGNAANVVAKVVKVLSIVDLFHDWFHLILETGPIYHPNFGKLVKVNN